MRSKLKRGISGACIISLSLLLMSCGGQTQSTGNAGGTNTSSTISVEMGVEPWIGYGPWAIADKKGFFKKNGLDVKLVTFNQDSDINSAFASGHAQVANVATHTALRLKGNNSLDFQAVLFLDESERDDAILAPSSVTSINQLQGKRIAFEEGTTSDLLIHYALNESSIPFSAVSPVYMPASDAGLSLVSKKVDAAVTYEPYISEILSKDKSLHIIYSGADAPGLISDVTIVNSTFLTQHPDVKSKLQQAWDESIKFWRDNPQEGDAIIAQFSGVEPAQMSVIKQGLKVFSLDEQKQMWTSGKMLDAVNNIQSTLLAQGMLKSKVDAQSVFHIMD
ncbi:MAG TPA: ABC transporter substrate-binding protein [Alicyclobacillus sp.]|nr:ABC transporter substrate-binding protein [Alicyclobacillus sp.]